MKQRSEVIIYLLLCSLIWIYLWLRAAWVPVVHDEAATFLFYVQSGKFLPFLSHWDANNHILNSAFSTLFYNLFGISLLSLRLANLLVFPLFCFFLWKTGGFISNPFIKWCFFISLLMAHGFLEFFSLSRGYGMSMAFLMPAIYNLIRLSGRFSTRDSLLTVMWITLATLANLTLIVTFLIIPPVILLHVFFQRTILSVARRIQSAILILITWIPPMALFITILGFYREKALLYTGGSRGFLPDVIQTLTDRLFPTFEPLAYCILFPASAFILFITILSIIRNRSLLSYRFIFLYLLAGNVGGIILIHFLVGVNYPENRAALYLLPFFNGALCFATEDACNLFRRKALILILIPLAVIPFHFLSRLNFSHSEFYREDPVPERFFSIVSSERRDDGFPATIGGERLRHFCWSFPVYLHGGRENPIFWLDFPGQLTDFQIADKKDLPAFAGNYHVIDSMPELNRFLLKRNKPVEKRLIVTKEKITSNGFTNAGYFVFFKMPADSLIHHSLKVEVEAEIVSREEPLNIWMAAEVRDSLHRALRYDYMPLNWIRPAWNGSDSLFRKSFLFHDLPVETKSFRVYIWNSDSVLFRIDRCRVTIRDILNDSE
jgi:hypothetical protein